jgi:type I site-specific restriction endonuclease
VALTPEEWVRQHFIRFLVEEREVPRGLVAVEYAFQHAGRARRADAVLFDRDARPLAMIECKAPSVPLQQAVFDQIALYNAAVQARYLIVTNGRQHFCYTITDGNRFSFLDAIPTFEEMLAGKSV